MPITKNGRLILEILGSNKPKIKEDEDRITVHAAVSRFAFFYEKIRNLVDYKDEHLIRKSAILRILKRQLLLEQDPRVMAEQLIRELIAARYLQNGALPVGLIDSTAWIMYKLQLVLKVNAGSENHNEWLRTMAAVEIEDILVDATREKALVSFLFDRIRHSVKVRGTTLDDYELRLQIYVACYRTLIKADDEIIGYKLLRAYLPEWLSPQSWMENPRPIAERLVAVEQRIKRQLTYSLSQRFQKAVKPWAVSLNMLTETLTKKPAEAPAMVDKPEALKAALANHVEERYTVVKARLRRGTMRAMLYLLLTKMILALVLEVPIEWYSYQVLHFEALLINLLFPPFIMFMVGLFIRLPGYDNTERILLAAEELVSDQQPTIKTIVAPRPRSAFATTVLTLVYAFTFIVTFGLIALILGKMSFTWISTLIFILFLCLVSFFAYRLRMGAREIVVMDGKVTLWNSLVDFFSIPILQAGRFLSQSISRINIFLFFFDFIFEAPYKFFLSLLEEWFAFAKEKKDELQP
ncbi:MAG: hypothetical protein PHC53_04430 [Patescibacteria group bacterium]|nr:hypothetical protein [Patescibacteria group bacterium]